jgi:hypothetical protein
VTGPGTGLRTGLAGLAGVLLLAGCGSAAQASLSPADPPAPTATTGTATPAPVSTDPPLPVTTDPVPVDTPTAPAPAACPAGALQASVRPAAGAAGHDAVPLVLTNTGTAPCTVTGYPTVQLLATPDRTPIGPAAAHDAGPQPAVLLAPGGRATATLSIARAGLYDPADCRPAPADALTVAAPGSQAAQPVPLPAPVDACRSATVAQLSVTALAAG